VCWLDNPDLAEQNEKHKQDLLNKQKEGKGHWKPELASNSEEAVFRPAHLPLDPKSCPSRIQLCHRSIGGVAGLGGAVKELC
jgi:hypothetical protein